MSVSQEDLEPIARMQRRQQVVVLVLAAAVFVSAAVTWSAVGALREANEVQRQLLSGAKPGAARAMAARQGHDRPVTADADGPQSSRRSVAAASPSRDPEPEFANQAGRAPAAGTTGPRAGRQ